MGVGDSRVDLMGAPVWRFPAGIMDAFAASDPHALQARPTKRHPFDEDTPARKRQRYTRSKRQTPAARVPAPNNTTPNANVPTQETRDARWPCEILDMVLNGPLGLYPAHRALARGVCRQWRDAIHCPSVHDGDRIRASAPRGTCPDRWLRGRCVTASSVCTWLHGLVALPTLTTILGRARACCTSVRSADVAAAVALSGIPGAVASALSMVAGHHQGRLAQCARGGVFIADPQQQQHHAQAPVRPYRAVSLRHALAVQVASARHPLAPTVLSHITVDGSLPALVATMQAAVALDRAPCAMLLLGAIVRRHDTARYASAQTFGTVLAPFWEAVAQHGSVECARLMAVALSEGEADLTTRDVAFERACVLWKRLQAHAAVDQTFLERCGSALVSDASTGPSGDDAVPVTGTGACAFEKECAGPCRYCAQKLWRGSPVPPSSGAPQQPGRTRPADCRRRAPYVGDQEGPESEMDLARDADYADESETCPTRRNPMRLCTRTLSPRRFAPAVSAKEHDEDCGDDDDETSNDIIIALSTGTPRAVRWSAYQADANVVGCPFFDGSFLLQPHNGRHHNQAAQRSHVPWPTLGVLAAPWLSLSNTDSPTDPREALSLSSSDPGRHPVFALLGDRASGLLSALGRPPLESCFRVAAACGHTALFDLARLYGWTWDPHAAAIAALCDGQIDIYERMVEWHAEIDDTHDGPLTCHEATNVLLYALDQQRCTSTAFARGIRLLSRLGYEAPIDIMERALTTARSLRSPDAILLADAWPAATAMHPRLCAAALDVYAMAGRWHDADRLAHLAARMDTFAFLDDHTPSVPQDRAPSVATDMAHADSGGPSRSNGRDVGADVRFYDPYGAWPPMTDTAGRTGGRHVDDGGPRLLESHVPLWPIWVAHFVQRLYFEPSAITGADRDGAAGTRDDDALDDAQQCKIGTKDETHSPTGESCPANETMDIALYDERPSAQAHDAIDALIVLCALAVRSGTADVRRAPPDVLDALRHVLPRECVAVANNNNNNCNNKSGDGRKRFPVCMHDRCWQTLDHDAASVNETCPAPLPEEPMIDDAAIARVWFRACRIQPISIDTVLTARSLVADMQPDTIMTRASVLLGWLSDAGLCGGTTAGTVSAACSL